MQMAFLERKELLHERVAAFVKALATMALQLPTNYAMACVALARGGESRGLTASVTHPLPHGTPPSSTTRRDVASRECTPWQGDVPEQVNAHAATLWELCLLHSHFNPTVAAFAREMEQAKSLRMDQRWREVLKRDYSHKVFTASRLTKRREEEMDEEDIDALVDHAFESDEE